MTSHIVCSRPFSLRRRNCIELRKIIKATTYQMVNIAQKNINNNIQICMCIFHSFAHSFIRSFVHSFVHSFIRSFVDSFVRAYTSGELPMPRRCAKIGGRDERTNCFSLAEMHDTLLSAEMNHAFCFYFFVFLWFFFLVVCCFCFSVFVCVYVF